MKTVLLYLNKELKKMLTSSHEVENSDTIQVHESHTVKLGFFFFSFVSWFSLIGHLKYVWLTNLN